MKALRTPDERFENLPGYPFAPHRRDGRREARRRMTMRSIKLPA